jgi:2-phosphosulfolactate phosphatase
MEIIDKETKPIKISLFFAPNYVESELELKDKNVVVVDVLRTSTTMVTGLANGAKEIIPTESIAAAGMIGRNSQGQSLLCGERNGKVIEGFNLGNSIKEYSEENVKGKILVFNSTNGTPSLMKAKFARNCAVLGFVNMSRVVDFISNLQEDFIILCSGKNEEFSLEDTVCAGMLINELSKKSKNNYELTDSALGASRLYETYKKSLITMLKESEHGNFLVSIGFEDDLAECSKVDVHNILPLLRNGVIRTLESFTSDPKLTMKKVTQKNAG